MQHLVLLALLILVVGLILTINKLPAGMDLTFSQRVANNKQAEILYSLLFIVTLPILFIFFVIWFVPTTGISPSFLWFAAIAVVSQVVCTWIPERGGTMTTVHRIFTGISGIALIPMVAIIATSDSITSAVRAIAWIILTLMIVLLSVALINQKGFKYALLLQVVYYALFFTILVLTTYSI